KGFARGKPRPFAVPNRVTIQREVQDEEFRPPPADQGGPAAVRVGGRLHIPHDLKGEPQRNDRAHPASPHPSRLTHVTRNRVQRLGIPAHTPQPHAGDDVRRQKQTELQRAHHVKTSMMSPPATNSSSTARLPGQTNTAARSWRSTTQPAMAMEAIAMLFVGPAAQTISA